MSVSRRPTSRLGFGCASLGSRIGKRDGLRLLGRALDLGITHFDVAPSYGRGYAEEILGRFLKGKQGRVTVCTKFGIEPAPRRAYTPMLLAAGRMAQAMIPRLRRQVGLRAPARRHADVTPALLRRSVERSLRALRADHIAILAFHDCSVEAALRRDLRAELQSLVSAGKVGRVSIATDGQAAASIMRKISGETYRVVQCANSAFDPLLDAGWDAFASADLVITHSAFGNGNGLERLAARLADMPEWGRALAEYGIDLATPEAAARTLLRYALATNPGGVVLVSTTKPEHLAANFAIAEPPVEMPLAVRRLLVDLAGNGGMHEH